MASRPQTVRQLPIDRLHAEMLDEGLTLLTKFWSGERFSYQGKHYQINEAQFLPTPRQTPHVPIWIGGVWPNKPPFRRAAQWDGVCPIGREHVPTPAEIDTMLNYIKQHRQVDTPFDVVLGAYERDAPDNAAYADYAAAGVTWWLECFDWHDTLDTVHARIRQGPPHL